MKYPKLQCEEKHNTVVCRNDIKKMEIMRKEGSTFQEIANQFKISYRTAWIHSASPEKIKESKLRVRKRNKIYNYNRYTNDSEFREKMINSNVKSIKERRNSNPKFRKYMYQLSQKYNLKKIKDYPTWSSRCRYNLHITGNAIQKCLNAYGKCSCSCHK